RPGAGADPEPSPIWGWLRRRPIARSRLRSPLRGVGPARESAGALAREVGPQAVGPVGVQAEQGVEAGHPAGVHPGRASGIGAKTPAHVVVAGGGGVVAQAILRLRVEGYIGQCVDVEAAALALAGAALGTCGTAEGLVAGHRAVQERGRGAVGRPEAAA